MALPASQELQFQILTLLNDQNVHQLPEVKDVIARKFQISSEDRKKISKNRRPVFESRIIHSLSMLRKSGLIVNQKRANFKITKSGLNKLKNA